MTYVQEMPSDGLRIIHCLEFDPHARPDHVEALKRAIVDSPNTLHSAETTGDFNFMFEVAPPDLSWYQNWLKALAEPWARLVRHHASSFVCRRFIRRPKNERALWVPAEGGLKRIDCALIDKVAADRDYVRIHSAGHIWLLHSTLHAVHDHLSGKSFVQLHRSVIVRIAFIDKLIREGRRWIARLKDGTAESIAQAHVADVLQITRSPTTNQGSSKPADLVDSRAAG